VTTSFGQQSIGRQVSLPIECVDQKSVGQIVFDQMTRHRFCT
jgi:hypothetical protein